MTATVKGIVIAIYDDPVMLGPRRAVKLRSPAMTETNAPDKGRSTRAMSWLNRFNVTPRSVDAKKDSGAHVTTSSIIL